MDYLWTLAHSFNLTHSGSSSTLPVTAMMIVAPDDQPSKQLSDQKDQTVQPKVDYEEPPPSYSASSESDFIASGSAGAPTYKTKPTNYLSLSTKNSTIRGEFVIDPSMAIPSSTLPPLDDGQTEEDRKNLSLVSKHDSVHADIWLLGGTIGAHKPRRTTIALASDHDSIRAQVHALDGTAPFLLTARAAHDGVRIALPRSFQGFLHLTTRHGSISLSDTLVQNATQLSQVDNMRRYFIGDFQAVSEDEWEGGQVEIEAPHGSIRIKYVDETSEAQGKKGLFSRLFGK